MKDRIEEIMRSEGLSAADFADRIGINRSGLSHIMNGRNNPSLDFVMKIHNAFPSISLDWLLDGRGEPYEGVSQKNDSDSGIIFDDDTLFSDQSPERREYRKENEVKQPNLMPKEIVKQEVKYVEKPSRKITEIRIFFDDDTFEIFIPRK